jgi:hypothetical protein
VTSPEALAVERHKSSPSLRSPWREAEPPELAADALASYKSRSTRSGAERSSKIMKRERLGDGWGRGKGNAGPKESSIGRSEP